MVDEECVNMSRYACLRGDILSRWGYHNPDEGVDDSFSVLPGVYTGRTSRARTSRRLLPSPE